MRLFFFDRLNEHIEKKLTKKSECADFSTAMR